MSEKKPENKHFTPKDFSEVTAQANLVSEVMKVMEPQIESLFSSETVSKISKVYLVGCGDSYFAAYAARLAFDKYSGIQTEPVESLEFSRYIVDYMPENSLVIPISNSGQVARTVESSFLAQKNRAITIPLTGNSSGPLAKSAKNCLLQVISSMEENVGPNDVTALGLGNFSASLTSLYLLALHLGVMNNKIDGKQKDELKHEMCRSIAIIAETAEKNSKNAMTLAAKLWNISDFVILGGGPGYAVNMFTAAKLLEQPQLRGIVQELEEWAHLEYFLVRPNTSVTIVICPPGNCHDRAVEQIRGAKDMGSLVIAICDSDDKEILDLVDYSLPVNGKIAEEFSPLTYIVPGQLFATALHKIVGRKPHIPPYTQELMREINYRQIWQGCLRHE